MNYEKKYNEALERAKKWYYAPNADKIPTYANRVIEEIFPELKESKDERIRRNIIAALRGEGYYDCDLTNECVAWLEKQGEKSLTVDIKSMVKSYKQRVLEQSNNMESPLVNICVESFRHGIESTLDELNLKNLEKQGEQKPTWNVEDSSKVQRICQYLNEAKKYYADITEVRECMDWLKSLEDRVQPKPTEWSDEDEEYLRRAINATKDGYPMTTKWLKSLKTRLS